MRQIRQGASKLRIFHKKKGVKKERKRGFYKNESV